MVSQDICMRGQHDDIMLVMQGDNFFRITPRGSTAG
jgi:hypothetical protein